MGKLNITVPPFIFLGNNGVNSTPPPPPDTSIYLGDGALVSDRTLSGAGFFLKFTGITDYEVSNAFSSFTLADVTGNWSLTGAGTGILSSVAKMSFDSSGNNIALQSLAGALRNVGIGNDGTFGTKLDLEVADGSKVWFSLYENRVGGAIQGDLNSIDAYFNDSAGVRTKGGAIQFRVDQAPTPADVMMSCTVNSHLKVQPTGRIFITQGATTGASNGQVEIRGVAGVSAPVTLWLRGESDTGNVLFCRNNSNVNLFQVLGTGQVLANPLNLVGGDFIHEGFTDIDLFRSDAGLDRVGVGCTIAQLSSKFNVDGDIETLTNTKGLIVLDRTNGNRYRIYTDGGILNTELA